MSEIQRIRNQIRKVSRRLSKPGEDPRNSDRVLWGALAAASFAGVTGQSEDLTIDPETILGDLLAALMHWSDAQKRNPLLEETIDFESALERARNHYHEESAAVENNGVIVRSDPAG